MAYVELDINERKLVAFAKKDIRKRLVRLRKAGKLDKLYAYVLSEGGKIHSGSPFSVEGVANCVHAEMLALGNMLHEEGDGAKAVCIFVAGPVPADGIVCTKPCGMCRLYIHENSTRDATVICSCFARKGKNWDFFPKTEIFKIGGLYPNPYREPVWD